MALAAGLLVVTALSAADSFTPVRMSITVASVARRHAPLKIRVQVTADPDSLNTSGEGPVRIEVKLAGECGGDFQNTSGDTLLNQRLKPQPSAGKPYSATANGSGHPRDFGVRTVCAYVEDTAVGRVYANDESLTVNVSRRCTEAGTRYDAAKRALMRARRRLRHAHTRSARRRDRRVVARRRRGLAKARRRGVAACGRGVPL
jgi:hypothetical protein